MFLFRYTKKWPSGFQNHVGKSYGSSRNAKISKKKKFSGEKFKNSISFVRYGQAVPIDDHTGFFIFDYDDGQHASFFLIG